MTTTKSPESYADTCRVVLAETIPHLDDATRIRWEVYAKAMDLDDAMSPALREINGFDVLDTSWVFIAYVSGEAVGTLRMTGSNPSLATKHGTNQGFPLAIDWDLRDVPDAMVLAELGRLAILSDHRGRLVAGYLYKAAYEAALEAGITHWVGTTLTGTDVEEDAAIIAAAIANRGRLQAQPQLLARTPARPAEPRRPLFTGEQRTRASAGDYDAIRLPASVKFHLRTNVRAIGPPKFDADFEEYLIPLIVSMEDFAISDLGIRYC